MKFTEKNMEGLTVFELEGKIMGDSESISLCKRLKEVIDSGERHILLDFSSVRWINSPGIGGILACLNVIRKFGGDLLFTGLSGRVAYYFRITKLDTTLKIYEHIDAARRALVDAEICS
ncbi:STAS domain-containing protein [candidate division KSB1 bacterium]|nr:STAS domain-containing protein [candidate division KSB1 bacterium]